MSVLRSKVLFAFKLVGATVTYDVHCLVGCSAAAFARLVSTMSFLAYTSWLWLVVRCGLRQLQDLPARRTSRSWQANDCRVWLSNLCLVCLYSKSLLIHLQMSFIFDKLVSLISAHTLQSFLLYSQVSQSFCLWYAKDT